MTSEPKHWNDRFDEEFKRESDRAIAIVAAALLEQALEAILRNHMAPSGGQDDPLFDGAYAPLSNFSSKIDLSHRLGLVTSRWSRDLHLIRRIRNAFAHDVSGCSFDDVSVRSRVLELTRSQRVVETAKDVRDHYPEGPKGDFGMTVSWMLWWLWCRAGNVSQVDPATDWVPTLEHEHGETTLGAAPSAEVAAGAPTTEPPKKATRRPNKERPTPPVKR